MSCSLTNFKVGFYAEGKAVAASPFTYDVVYVSGELRTGHNWLNGRTENGIVGRKFTHEVLISADEFRGFYQLSDDTLYKILKQQGLPDGFEKWLQEKRRSD